MTLEVELEAEEIGKDCDEWSVSSSRFRWVLMSTNGCALRFAFASESESLASSPSLSGRVVGSTWSEADICPAGGSLSSSSSSTSGESESDDLRMYDSGGAGEPVKRSERSSTKYYNQYPKN